MIRDFESVVEALVGEPGVTLGRSFASEGLRVGKRIFAMEVKGALVVKVSAERAAALCKARVATPFDPGHGRVMKQWISVSRRAKIDWVELAREALVFVRG